MKPRRGDIFIELHLDIYKELRRRGVFYAAPPELLFFGKIKAINISLL